MSTILLLILLKHWNSFEMKNNRLALSVRLPAGYLPPRLAVVAAELAERFSLRLYLQAALDLRVAEICEEDFETVKSLLAGAGAEFARKGTFPKPRICSGSRYCRRGQVDTEAFSTALLEHFGNREVKPKIKLAIAGCPRNCSNPKLADIGIVAGVHGFEVYVGGRAGANPVAGRKIAAGLSQQEVFALLETLLAFHNGRAEKRVRMYQLMKDEAFPFPVL
jgi:NAD(P)H-nitrite reductase large subunit